MRLLGLRGDVPRLLPGADLGLLTSVSEGIPLTALEAMAAGLPVLATRVGGLVEVVDDGRTGLLAAAGDDEALAEAALLLAADPALRAAMGQAGRQRAEELFSEARMVSEYDRLYAEMLGGAAEATILAVTSQVPWPLDSGGHLRTFHLLRSLAGLWPVRLVVPAPPGQGRALDALRAAGIDVRPVPVGPRRGWREALRAAAAAARGEPYVFYRRHDRRAVRDALRAEARREAPGLLYLDHLDSLVYRSALPGVPCLIDLHNVYSVIARRAAADRGRLAAAPTSAARRRCWSGSSACAAGAADVLTAVSEEDGARLPGARGARGPGRPQRRGLRRV